MPVHGSLDGSPEKRLRLWDNGKYGRLVVHKDAPPGVLKSSYRLGLAGSQIFVAEHSKVRQPGKTQLALASDKRSSALLN